MRDRKNIAILGTGIIGAGPLDQGIPAMVNALAKLLETHSITLYSFIPINKTKAPEGIRVRCVTNKNINLKLKYISLFLQFSIDHFFNKFDVVHAQSPYPAGIMSIWLNKFFRIPWILFLDASETIGLPEIPFGDLLNPRLRKAAFEVCSKTKIIVALTQFHADQTRQHMKLDREILVLHRGVSSYSYTEKSLTYPIQFLHISYYHPIKDYVTLFKTFAILHNQFPCELVVLGDGYSANVKELIDSLGIGDKIKFLKPIPNENLNELFSKTHILLHTSIYESQGMVALEAMAHGVVVCGTHVGILADLSEKYCVAVPIGNYQLLAEEVMKIINDESQYHHLKMQAYSWVSGRDLQWYASELEKIYFKGIQANRNVTIT